MKDKLQAYLQYKKDLSKDLKKYVQDKSIPLEDRWQALITAPELAETSNTDILNLDRGDDFISGYPLFISRNETRSVDHVLRQLESATTPHPHWVPFTKEDVILVKEYCCDNFIGILTYYW